MMPYQCMIVDDEPIAHRVLETYLQAHPRMQVCAHAYHTDMARQYCAEQPIDLLLLDIQMPGETGLDFLRSLETKPLTILTTAHQEYTLEGYELGVLDYLLKPVSKERCYIALNRAIEFLDLLHLQSVISSIPSVQASISVQSGAKTIQLPLGKISHVQGLKDYAIIHTPEKRYVLRMTMKRLEVLLQPHGFVRIHKSFIVSADKIPLIHRNKIEFEGFQIPVGRRFKG